MIGRPTRQLDKSPSPAHIEHRIMGEGELTMKNAIFALLVALGLAAAFIGYASVSFAGGSNADGSYMDDQTTDTRP
jgi:hypothetical protein